MEMREGRRGEGETMSIIALAGHIVNSFIFPRGSWVCFILISLVLMVHVAVYKL